MNTEALFLFLILLLGLILCSFLGGNCGKEGFITSSSTFTSQSGGTIVVTTGSNGTLVLTVTLKGSSPLTFTSSSSSATTFSGPDGATATVTQSNGVTVIQVKTSNGMVLDTFTQSGSATTNSSTPYDNYNHFNSSSSSSSGSTFTSQSGGTVVVNPPSNNQQTLTVVMTPGQPPLTFSGTASSTTFTGPSGSTATITTVNGQKQIQVKTSNGMVLDTFTQSGSTTNTTSSTKYYGSTGSPIQPSDYSLAYQGSSAGIATGPQGNSAYYAQGPQGNTVAGTTSSGYGNQYNNALPQGVPRSQIPSGDEDLYILKSQVVPPVCPVCPVGAACPRKEKCPPCPACARCPEPSFECKKIPNYNAINNDQLPLPVLNDFSSFGM